AARETTISLWGGSWSRARGGFLLAPWGVAADGSGARSALEAVVIYLLIYGAMTGGAFAVVIAVARRTRSGEIASYSGLGQTAPGLAIAMTIFLFSLAGIPPLAGWFAKFVMFRAVFDAHTASSVVLGVIAAVASVIAFFYYAGVTRMMWFHDPLAEYTTEMRGAAVPPALTVAIALTMVVVLVIGIYPQLFARVGELAFQA